MLHLLRPNSKHITCKSWQKITCNNMLRIYLLRTQNVVETRVNTSLFFSSGYQHKNCQQVKFLFCQQLAIICLEPTSLEKVIKSRLHETNHNI